jgi:hypothetical protein
MPLVDARAGMPRCLTLLDLAPMGKLASAPGPGRCVWVSSVCVWVWVSSVCVYLGVCVVCVCVCVCASCVPVLCGVGGSVVGGGAEGWVEGGLQPIK